MIGADWSPRSPRAIIVGDWQLTDALVPLVMLALFPFFEWMVHVFILHWRPSELGRLTIDPLLAREHRAHHVDPRERPADLHTVEIAAAVGASADGRALRCWRSRGSDSG